MQGFDGQVLIDPPVKTETEAYRGKLGFYMCRQFERGMALESVVMALKVVGTWCSAPLASLTRSFPSRGRVQLAFNSVVSTVAARIVERILDQRARFRHARHVLWV